MHGTALNLTVKGINTEEVVDTKLVELTATPRDIQAFETLSLSLREGIFECRCRRDKNITGLQETPAPSSSRRGYILLCKH